MLQVYTDNGDTVYYTKKIEYFGKSIPVEDGEPVVLVYVKFVPKNGPSRGLPMTMLVTQVSSIVETDQAFPDYDQQARDILDAVPPTPVSDDPRGDVMDDEVFPEEEQA
jgi:hypothetical protein